MNNNSFLDSALILAAITGFLYVLGFFVLSNVFTYLDIPILYMEYTPYNFINSGFRSLISLVFSNYVLSLFFIVPLIYSAFFEIKTIVFKFIAFFISFILIVGFCSINSEEKSKKNYKNSVECLKDNKKCKDNIIRDFKIVDRTLSGIIMSSSSKHSVIVTMKGIEVVLNDNIEINRIKHIILKEEKSD